MFSISLDAGNLLLLLSVLVFVAVLSNKIGAKFGVPSMLVFLIIGMLAGPDGMGLEFHNLHLAEFICHLCMTVILLTGGLARSEYIVSRIRQRVGFLAPIRCFPGEDEMEALALNALAVLRGKRRAKEYK